MKIKRVRTPSWAWYWKHVWVGACIVFAVITLLIWGYCAMRYAPYAFAEDSWAKDDMETGALRLAVTGPILLAIPSWLLGSIIGTLVYLTRLAFRKRSFGGNALPQDSAQVPLSRQER